jgi:hypothetical protein
MNFVDEKCSAFEDEDENKLIYTVIHKEFCEHVETLIDSNLCELGINNIMFLESCEKARHTRDINSTVFERLLAMEDFQTFKKIMTKRNTELNIESMKSISSFTPIMSRSIKMEESKSKNEFKDGSSGVNNFLENDDLLDPELLNAYKESQHFEELEDDDVYTNFYLLIIQTVK